MANVSSSNSLEENVPKLRFPEFSGKWEAKRFSDIFDEIIEKNHPELPVLSILQGTGTVLRDSLDRKITYNKANITGYKAMKKGDFIIHLRSFEGGLEISNHEGISSPAYKILRSDYIISDAYKDYFRSYKFIEGKLSPAVTGIRDGKNIDMPTFWEIQINIPQKEEQIKIANFFALLDQNIKKQKQLIELLKLYKRGLLLKLFPQKGETAPQYRFKGFTNTWEQRKLREIIVDYSEKNPVNEDLPVLTSSRKGIQTQEEHFGSTQKHDTTDYNVIPKGYCTYRNRSDDKSFTFNVNDCIERGIVSKFYPVFSVDKGNAKFLTTYLNSNETIRKRLAVLSVGTSQVVLSMTQLKELELLIPSKAEQDKIGSFLYEFDNLITFHQEKCYSYEKIKSVLLQQMFI